jgi:hypothetical protein
MAPPAALWLFAHRALSGQFHQDPAKFVATLDNNAAAPRYLEQLWTWALGAAGVAEPARPPLKYGIDRPRAGLAIVWMELAPVKLTGEPWQIRFIVRDPDAGASNGYTRMFLLEHSEYASELAAKPQAIVCESPPDGKHLNWGATLAPDDTKGYDDAVIVTLRSKPTS